MTRLKRWKVHSQNKSLSQQLSKSLQQSEILAQILLNRGISNLMSAQAMLGRYHVIDQFSDDSLSSVVSLIQSCIEQKRPILLYGDYDVDGMTSTTIMVKLITLMGGVVRYRIPHRFDHGYGLNMDVVDLIQDHHIGLLITLDCGVTNSEEIRAVKEKTDAKVIVIDHHQIPDILPPFDAMLNPKSLEDTHGLYHLCTAGIVYKLVEYLAKTMDKINLDDFIDLAAIGTIADVATLQGDNHRIVNLGLKQLATTRNVGIQSLLKRAGFEQFCVSVRDIGFVIAPRLNAAGRLATAQYGVELLLSNTESEAIAKAERLEKMNNDRRAIDQQTLEECIQMIESDSHYLDRQVLVLGKKGWHAGVIGITASKLVDRYAKPVVIVAIDDHIARGSARTFGDVNMYSLLKQAQSFFNKFGGHKQAAGFSLLPEKFLAFKTFFDENVSIQIQKDQLYDELMVDMSLTGTDLSFELAEELQCIQPFGIGNEEPLFYSNDLQAVDFKTVGDGSHLKVTFASKSSNKVFNGIGFGLAEKLSVLYQQDIHVVFSVDINVWQNKRSLQLMIKDLK